MIKINLLPFDYNKKESIFKIHRFSLGKKKKYKGFAIKIYRLKLEIIIFGKKRLYRIEWNDWGNE